MKNPGNILCRRLMTLLLVTGLIVIPVRAQQSSAASSAMQRRPRRQLRIETPDNLTISITADGTLDDAVSYKSGDKFVVIVPQATVAQVQTNSRAPEIVAVNVEQRDDDVFVTIQLQASASASVNSRGQLLQILVSSAQPMVARASTRVPEPTTILPDRASAASETSNGVAAPVALAPPAIPQPLATPEIADILNKVFGTNAKNATVDVSNIDLSVPEAPAFAALGVTPSTVVRPGSPRQFASSFLSGLDQHGNFQTGLALDTAPFMVFNGENVSILDYNQNYMTRLLSRSQLSVAVTKGASTNDPTTRAAVGFNLTLWDEGDARIYHPERGATGDVLTCFEESLQLPAIKIPPLLPGGDQAAHDALVAKVKAENEAANNKRADDCRKSARKANWNRSSWLIAYAPTWISKTGQTTGFKWNGGSFWTSVAYGFEQVPSLRDIGQLILHARYRSNEQVPDEQNKGKFITQDSTLFGARFRAGSPKFGFNIEDVFVRTRPVGLKWNSSNRFSVGGELRLTDNVYFVLSAGGNSSGNNKSFLMSSFKYGFNKKSQLNPQPQ